MTMSDDHFSPDAKHDEILEDNPLATIQAATGQKRPQGDAGGPASKRAHIDGDDSVQVKVLIPAAAVGALIGKGGESMRNLKNETNCRVQMSKNQEVYHGTNERICLVKGKINSSMLVMEAIYEKIREKVDANQAPDAFDHKATPRNKEMKLLMPNTSAGMVIGKAGASIKEIRDATGCQIQVFPKAGTPEAKNSLERVVTVAHDDLSMLMKAVSKVLEKVAADPQHAANVQDKDDGYIPNSGYAGGSGGSYGGSSGGVGGGSGGYSGGAPWASGANSVSNGSGGGPSFRYNPMQGVGNNELLSFLDSLQSTLRTSGFNEASVAEVMQAMQVLAKYNIMGLGLGLGVAAMAQMRQTSGGGGGVGGGDSAHNTSFGGAGDQSFNGGGGEVRSLVAQQQPQSLQSAHAQQQSFVPPSALPTQQQPTQNAPYYQQQQQQQAVQAQTQQPNFGSAGYGSVGGGAPQYMPQQQQQSAPYAMHQQLQHQQGQQGQPGGMGGGQYGGHQPQGAPVQYQQSAQRVYITNR